MKRFVFIFTLTVTSVSLAKPLHVVASFSVLADMAQQIGGPEIEVSSLADKGQDPHSYEPRPADAVKIKNADLILVNGAGFDPWMDRLLASRENKKTPVITLTQNTGNPQIDSHCWQSPLCGEQFTTSIGEALQKIDPEHAGEIKKRTEIYREKILAIYQKYKDRFSQLSTEKKRFYLSHEALGAFTGVYGLNVIAPQISPVEELTAQQKVKTQKEVHDLHVHVAFAEVNGNNQAVEQSAKDLGMKLKGELYFDSLSTSGPGSTYLGLLEENAKRILQALTETP